jgi:predicted PurR-regulated permease PerM
LETWSFIFLNLTKKALMKTRLTLLYLIIGIAVFILFAIIFSNIFIYFVLSIVLAALLRPLTNRLNQIQIFSIKVPRVVAVLISFITFGIIITLFILLFIPLVSEQVTVLSSLNYQDLILRLTEPITRMEEFLFSYNFVSTEPGFFVANLTEGWKNFSSNIKLESLINGVLSFTGNVSIGILAVTFITFFLLYEKGLIRKQLISLIPNQYFEVSIAAVSKIEKLLSNYLLGLLLQMIAIFSMASIGLSIFGVKYSLVIAVFAALANLIPYAGPILGASFGILVGVSTMPISFGTPEFYWLIIKIVSVFSVVQVTDNIVLQPFIFSRSVKVHPLEIFVIIFAGASLGGIPGMIAAIPVYTVIRVSVKEFIQGYKQYHIFKI